MTSDAGVTRPEGPRRLMTGPYLFRNPVLVSVIRLLDFIGPGFRRRPKPLPQTGMRVLVANMAHLGDLVVLLPLLTALKASPRVAHVGVLIGSWGRPVVDHWGCADQVHVCDHWHQNRDDLGMVAKLRRHLKTGLDAIRQIRRARYDVAIDSYAYFGNASGLLHAAGLANSIGFCSGGGGGLYSTAVDFDPERSIAANQIRLLSVLDIAEISQSQRSTTRFQGGDPDQDQRLDRSVVFHIGSGRVEKDWPAASWIALGKRLQKDGFTVIFTGSRAEEKHGRPVRDAIGGRNMVGDLTFPELAELLAKVRAVITIDTVTAHLSLTAQTPTVVVAPGISPARLWYPPQSALEVVSRSMPCSPCLLTSGCDQMTCIRDTAPNDVYDALCRILQQDDRMIGHVAKVNRVRSDLIHDPVSLIPSIGQAG